MRGTNFPTDLKNGNELCGERQKEGAKKKVFLRRFHHCPSDGMNRIRFQGLKHLLLSALYSAYTAPPVKHRSMST